MKVINDSKENLLNTLTEFASQKQSLSRNGPNVKSLVCVKMKKLETNDFDFLSNDSEVFYDAVEDERLDFPIQIETNSKPSSIFKEQVNVEVF